MIFKEITERIR